MASTKIYLTKEGKATLNETETLLFTKDIRIAQDGTVYTYDGYHCSSLQRFCASELQASLDEENLNDAFEEYFGWDF